MLQEHDELPELPLHFNEAFRILNFLKQLRPSNESGYQPIPLSDVQMYICTVLRYSDAIYTRWLTEGVVGCDAAERRVISQKLSEKQGT